MFVPVAKSKKASPQLALRFGGSVRQQPNEIVNEIGKIAIKVIHHYGDDVLRVVHAE